MILALLLSLLTLASSPAHAQPACTDAFARTDYPAHMFSREEGAALDVTYFENMKFTARQFESWVTSPSSHTQFSVHAEVTGREPLSPEISFLSLQHRSVVYGDGRRGLYWPGVQMEAVALAGTYRHWVVTPKFSQPLEHHHVPSPLVKLEIEKYRGEQLKLVTFNSGIPQTVYQPKLDGIAQDALPKYKFDGAKAVYLYPPAAKLPDYLEQMGHELGRVKEKISRREPAASVLKSLARYYHLAMVGHPFVRANNSLVMAQVNVVLRILKMREVPHGELDYIVRSLDSREAEAYFIEYVKSLQ